jgi:hypothetical protein
VEDSEVRIIRHHVASVRLDEEDDGIMDMLTGISEQDLRDIIQAADKSRVYRTYGLYPAREHGTAYCPACLGEQHSHVCPELTRTGLS